MIPAEQNCKTKIIYNIDGRRKTFIEYKTQSQIEKTIIKGNKIELNGMIYLVRQIAYYQRNQISYNLNDFIGCKHAQYLKYNAEECIIDLTPLKRIIRLKTIKSVYAENRFSLN